MDVMLKQVKTLGDWLQVYRLYRYAFPPSERKPFSIIFRMTRQEKTDVWVVRKGRAFAGFATTINSDELVMLDYLAISPKVRGTGVGTCALRQLMAHYRGRGFFVEIEDPFAPGDDQSDRKRRRQFYRNCGLEPLRVMANVFGVPMELLGRDCVLTFADYQNFYRRQYSEYAAGHLAELPHPEVLR